MSAATCVNCGEREAQIDDKYSQDYLEFVDSGEPATVVAASSSSGCVF